MSTTIATNDQHMREFQEKVVAKLRADIGEMLPDAALAGLVQKAVEEQFFKVRKKVDAYGRVVEDRPSWFVEEVAKQAEPLIKGMVVDYIAANTDTIKKSIEQFLEAQNLTLLAVAAMRNLINQDMMDFTQNLAQRIRQGY